MWCERRACPIHQAMLFNWLFHQSAASDLSLWREPPSQWGHFSFYKHTCMVNMCTWLTGCSHCDIWTGERCDRGTVRPMATGTSSEYPYFQRPHMLSTRGTTRGPDYVPAICFVHCNLLLFLQRSFYGRKAYVICLESQWTSWEWRYNPVIIGLWVISHAW